MSAISEMHKIDSQFKLLFAIIINLLLTAFQVAGAVFSGSLALAADALHNFSDALSLVIAWAARKISQKPADLQFTYGYARSELIGALINLTTLIVIGLYLMYEGVHRIIEPTPIQGDVVIIIAVIALLIDLATSFLIFKDAKSSLNIKAAFLHNVSDALASLGVIVSGILIMYYDLYLADAIITLLISSFILYQGITTIPQVIKILMQASPSEVDTNEIINGIKSISGVIDFSHVHLWQLSEREVLLEAHVLVNPSSVLEARDIKDKVKERLASKYDINHSTIELDWVEDHHNGGCDY